MENLILYYYLEVLVVVLRQSMCKLLKLCHRIFTSHIERLWESCWRSSYIIKIWEKVWGTSCGLPNFGRSSQYFSDDFGNPSSRGVQPVNIAATEISLTQKLLGQTILYLILKFTIYSRHKYYSRARIYKSRCYQKHGLVLHQTSKS